MQRSKARSLEAFKRAKPDLNSFLAGRHARLRRLFQGAMNRKRPPTQMPKPARNAPCPCGSAKKYKRYCGAVTRQSRRSFFADLAVSQLIMGGKKQENGLVSPAAVRRFFHSGRVQAAMCANAIVLAAVNRLATASNTLQQEVGSVTTFVTTQ